MANLLRLSLAIVTFLGFLLLDDPAHELVPLDWVPRVLTPVGGSLTRVVGNT